MVTTTNNNIVNENNSRLNMLNSYQAQANKKNRKLEKTEGAQIQKVGNNKQSRSTSNNANDANILGTGSFLSSAAAEMFGNILKALEAFAEVAMDYGRMTNQTIEMQFDSAEAGAKATIASAKQQKKQTDSQATQQLVTGCVSLGAATAQIAFYSYGSIQTNKLEIQEEAASRAKIAVDEPKSTTPLEAGASEDNLTEPGGLKDCRQYRNAQKLLNQEDDPKSDYDSNKDYDSKKSMTTEEYEEAARYIRDIKGTELDAPNYGDVVAKDTESDGAPQFREKWATETQRQYDEKVGEAQENYNKYQKDAKMVEPNATQRFKDNMERLISKRKTEIQRFQTAQQTQVQVIAELEKSATGFSDWQMKKEQGQAQLTQGYYDSENKILQAVEQSSQQMTSQQLSGRDDMMQEITSLFQMLQQAAQANSSTQ